jgi:hypothetical protein
MTSCHSQGRSSGPVYFMACIYWMQIMCQQAAATMLGYAFHVTALHWVTV